MGLLNGDHYEVTILFKSGKSMVVFAERDGVHVVQNASNAYTSISLNCGVDSFSVDPSTVAAVAVCLR